MKRRVFSTLIVSVLLLGLSGIAAYAQDVKLVWTWCCGQDNRRVLFEELARQYSEQNPGVEVEAIYPGGSYPATIQTWIAGGAQVDVMWTGQNMWAFPFDPLDDLIDMGGDFTSVHPMMLEKGQWLGRQVVIPYGANTHTVAFNKGLFDEAGLSYPTPDWTWSEAFSMAQALTRTTGDGRQVQAGILPYGPAVFASYLNYGGPSYSEDGRRFDIANPGAILGAQTYVDASRRLEVSPLNAAEVNWNNGNLAMQQIGIFNVDAMRVEGIDWDVVPVPALNVGGELRRSTFVSMEAWGINAHSEHKQEARKFIRWLFSPEVMEQIGASGIVIPTSAYGYEAFLRQTPPPVNLQAFIESFDYGHQQISDHPAGSQIWSGIVGTEHYAQLLNGNADPGIVLPEWQRLGQAILDEYWASQD